METFKEKVQNAILNLHQRGEYLQTHYLANYSYENIGLCSPSAIVPLYLELFGNYPEFENLAYKTSNKKACGSQNVNNFLDPFSIKKQRESIKHRKFQENLAEKIVNAYGVDKKDYVIFRHGNYKSCFIFSFGLMMVLELGIDSYKITSISFTGSDISTIEFIYNTYFKVKSNARRKKESRIKLVGISDTGKYLKENIKLKDFSKIKLDINYNSNLPNEEIKSILNSLSILSWIISI